MNILKPVIFLMLLALAHFSASAETKGKAITQDFGYEYRLDSKVLGESRPYLVHLPESYKNTNQKYPVIYALDGASHFRHIVSAMAILYANDRMPEAIVVGIPNNPGTRGRDLAQKNDQFLNFLENELVPHIDGQYRTYPVNTLFGHSLAGYFTLHTMLNGSRFTNFIAASPHIIATVEKISSDIEAQLKNKKLKGKNLYFTMADAQGDGRRRVESVESLSSMLNKNADNNFGWKYQPIDQQEHMTTPYLTVYKGLTFAFTDYQMPVFVDTKEYLAKGGMKAVKRHFLNRANKYSVDDKILQATIRQIANLYMDDENTDEAIQLLASSVKKNPDSMRANFDLARAYQEIGDKTRAVKFFEKSLKLIAPGQEGFERFIKGQIDQLKAG